jgi:hypothetical protein
MLGENISRSKPLVQELVAHGFSLTLAGERLYLAFADFPWFAGASVDQLSDVLWPSTDHLYWPSLDIDLSVASIRDPKAFPLMAVADKSN